MRICVYEQHIVTADAPAPALRHRLIVDVHELLASAERPHLVCDPFELPYIFGTAYRDRRGIVSNGRRDSEAI